MRGVFVLLLAIMVFAPAAIAGRTSHFEYNPNAMPYVVPAPSSPDACTGAVAKCRNNVYSRCAGGYWRVMDYCKKYETCTVNGCMTNWPSKFPQVKITPLGASQLVPAPSMSITAHGTPVQVNI